MFLFFGTRPGKRRITQLPHLTCPYCGQKDSLKGTTHIYYVHLFWLPILKIGASRYAECSHCKGIFYEEEFTLEMEKAVAK